MMDLYPSLMSHVYPLWMNLGRTYSATVNISCVCYLGIDGRGEEIEDDNPRFIKKIRSHLSFIVDVGQNETRIK